jgi:hypothetical protein
MISFAHFGPSDAPRLKLQPRRVRLTQHWVQGGQLAGAALTPEAGLDLRPDGMLVFSAAMKPAAQDVFRAGQKEFVADLWKGNVVECFLGNPKSGRYLEMHLAPTGQWWSCVFSKIRVRETPEGRPLPLSVVHHRRDKSGRRWEASVQVPSSVLCKLLAVVSVMDLRANLAAIAHPVTGRSLYFSHAPLPGPKPDFHQPSAWLEMTQ